MRIAQVAPPFETVPPTRYGGTERVVASLTEALVGRGHDVTLFAPGDSRTEARLLPTVPEALWHAEPPLADMNPFWSITLDTVLEHIDEFDVVHSHLDYWGFPLARHSRVPVVTTLHGRLDLPELQPLYQRFKDVPLVSISDSQREPVIWANFVKTIYHGINLDELTFRGEPGRYLAFLGRIAPEKGAGYRDPRGASGGTVAAHRCAQAAAQRRGPQRARGPPALSARHSPAAGSELYPIRG